MINPEELKAVLEAAKGSEDKAKELLNEILRNAGLTKEENFEGIYPLLIILFTELYPVYKATKQFLHDMLILERQTMNYLELLGAPISDAESVLKDLEKWLKI
jgi:hypothetical protein